MSNFGTPFIIYKIVSLRPSPFFPTAWYLQKSVKYFNNGNKQKCSAAISTLSIILNLADKLFGEKRWEAFAEKQKSVWNLKPEQPSIMELSSP